MLGHREPVSCPEVQHRRQPINCLGSSGAGAATQSCCVLGVRVPGLYTCKLSSHGRQVVSWPRQGKLLQPKQVPERDSSESCQRPGLGREGFGTGGGMRVAPTYKSRAENESNQRATQECPCVWLMWTLRFADTHILRKRMKTISLRTQWIFLRSPCILWLG